jgi:hypothetical protein
MKRFRFLILLALFLSIFVLYFSARDIVDKESCGCGPPLASADGRYSYDEELAIFNNEVVNYRLAELAPSLDILSTADEAVLGTISDQRWIEIDLSDQKLYAHNGNNIDYEFLISGGKWSPTPKGEFRIWVKLKYTKMEGGKKENNTYYYLPNVPYVQYFYRGYGLHGAYWHNNFGNPMSHGCVNLSIPDAEKLFYWTSPLVSQGGWVAYSSKDNPGTRVVIHD